MNPPQFHSFTCEICNQSFEFQGSLDNHRRNKIPCDLKCRIDGCSFKASNRTQYKRHQHKQFHPKNKRTDRLPRRRPRSPLPIESATAPYTTANDQPQSFVLPLCMELAHLDWNDLIRTLLPKIQARVDREPFLQYNDCLLDDLYTIIAQTLWCEHPERSNIVLTNPKDLVFKVFLEDGQWHSDRVDGVNRAAKMHQLMFKLFTGLYEMPPMDVDSASASNFRTVRFFLTMAMRTRLTENMKKLAPITLKCLTDTSKCQWNSTPIPTRSAKGALLRYRFDVASIAVPDVVLPKKLNPPIPKLFSPCVVDINFLRHFDLIARRMKWDESRWKRMARMIQLLYGREFGVCVYVDPKDDADLSKLYSWSSTTQRFTDQWSTSFDEIINTSEQCLDAWEIYTHRDNENESCQFANDSDMIHHIYCVLLNNYKYLNDSPDLRWSMFRPHDNSV